ncbi:MAG: hypothetical protein WCR55_08960 [Lentisphaerota bacterium]
MKRNRIYAVVCIICFIFIIVCLLLPNTITSLINIISPKDIKWASKTIINPYQEIDFNTAEFIPGISHEHCTSQKKLENAYNRGIRFFAITNYQPSAPNYPLTGYNSPYEDWSDSKADKLITRYNVGSYKDFIDVLGNQVRIRDLLGAPNAEKTLFIGSETHISQPGSTYGSANHQPPLGGIPSTHKNLINWRKAFPLPYQNIDAFIFNAKRCMILNDGGLLIINHSYNISELKKWINLGCEGMEIYNNYYDELINKRFQKAWDTLLTEGYRLWGFAVVDWEEVRQPIKGCNLIVGNMKGFTKEQKELQCLRAYKRGQFFASWYGRMRVQELSSNNVIGKVVFKLLYPAKILAKTNNREITFESTNTAEVNLLNDESYIRFEATDGLDYLWTNPMFIEQ